MAASACPSPAADPRDLRRRRTPRFDELTLDIASILLGSVERIFDGVAAFDFEPVEVLHSPPTTHIRYRRVS